MSDTGNRDPSYKAAAEDGAVPTNTARQGVTGHNVRYVLMGGVVSVVVLFTIAYIAFFT